MQDPVDAQAHEGEVALGLEVDVGGALLEGVAQDVVEGLDHRRRRRVELLRVRGEELLVAEVDVEMRPAVSCFSAVFRLALRS